MAEGGFVRTYTDITARKRAEDKVRYLALHDELTQLVKRAALHDHLEQALATADEDHCVAVMCLDLDRFKEINDTRGHKAGDQLLARAAERMRGCVRASDLVARLGGDEFAILLTCLPTPSIAAAIARDLLTEIAAPYALEGGLARVGLSIGIAFAPQDGSKVDQLLQRADAALYEAKRMGRGRFRLYGALLAPERDDERPDGAALDARTAPRPGATQ
jgi:diguanylate cyclase (GGDEF)-like protein